MLKITWWSWSTSSTMEQTMSTLLEGFSEGNELWVFRVSKSSSQFMGIQGTLPKATPPKKIAGLIKGLFLGEVAGGWGGTLNSHEQCCEAFGVFGRKRIFPMKYWLFCLASLIMVYENPYMTLVVNIPYIPETTGFFHCSFLNEVEKWW